MEKTVYIDDAFIFFMHINLQGMKAAILNEKGDAYLIVDSY